MKVNLYTTYPYDCGFIWIDMPYPYYYYSISPAKGEYEFYAIFFEDKEALHKVIKLRGINSGHIVYPAGDYKRSIDNL
jgi:hypothetical protein